MREGADGGSREGGADGPGAASLPPLIETATEAGRMVECRYPPGLEMGRHHHETGNVSLVIHGWLEEETDHGTHRAGPGSVVVKPAGTEHADRFGDAGCRMLALELSASAPAPGGTDVGAEARGALERWRWTDGGPPARLMLRLLATLRRCPEELERSVEEALWALPDALDAVVPERAGGAPAWLRRVRDRLHDEIRDPPLVRELAAGESVHPTYLTRRFKQHFGVPVTRYVRRRRARLAAGMIARSEEPLGAIAFRAGFADQSHLCRVFKEELGMTPGTFRSVV